jgi:hypothetical protein
MPFYGGGGGAPINGPQGLPIMKPPYSEVIATNMDQGEAQVAHPDRRCG